MQPVDEKLAQWKSIYDQLRTLRARRDQAFNTKGTAQALDVLDAEVARLQKASDDALNALYKAIAASEQH